MLDPGPVQASGQVQWLIPGAMKFRDNPHQCYRVSVYPTEGS